ncbi:MAG: GGDEF domain-containing protein, partial [Bacillota bacterium]
MQNYLRNRTIVVSLCFLFLLLFITFSYIHRSDTLKLLPERFTTLNENWEIYFGDMYVQTVDLPADINVGKDTTYFAVTQLPNTPNSYDHLLIRASLQDLTVYLDGEIIHEKINERNGYLRTPLTSSWELVYLPHNYQGKELTIQIRSETNAFAGTINPIHIGSADAMLFDMIKHQSLNFIVGLILFILAIVCLLIALSQRKFIDNRLLYLGLLSLTTSLWIFGESKLLQFITGNPFIIGGLSYLMVPLIVSFVALYIKEVITKRFITLFRIVSLTFSLIAFFMLFLQQYNILNFIESMAILLTISLISAIIQVGALIYEYRKDHNLEIKKVAGYFTVLIIAFLFESILFYTKSFQAISSMLLIGFLIFFILLFIDTYKYIKHSAEQARKTQLLETLAYQDLLTDGLNRTAYERDLKKKLGDAKHFRLVLIDLNHLKYINDTYGHTSGDHAIATVYKVLLDAFEGEHCYRIGGDEFVVLSDQLDKRIYQHQL